VPDRPNILLVLTDQQRFDTIAALGNPLIRTPTLDRLVREGTAFTRAYTPSPVCVSARCALATGLSPHRTGCVDNGPMPLETPSLMDRLGAAGYQCHGAGKMHFGPDWRALWGFESSDFSEECNAEDDFRTHLDAHGYQHVEDPHGVRSEYYYLPQPSQLPARLHHSAWVVDRSLDFVARRDRRRPFFLWTSFIKPHPPFEAPTPWNKLYRCPDMPRPKRPADAEQLWTWWNRYQNRYKYRDQGTDDNLLRTMKAAYWACISFLDFHLGRLLAGIEDLDNTLVLFSSDHGEMLGDYGCVGKRTMLDAACRIPLLARWPGRFDAGSRCAEPASLVDILPTCLQAAGHEVGAGLDGVSLLDLAAGDTAREAVESQLQRGAHGLYMRATRRFKYVYSAADDREWLFDAETDPDETRDAAGEAPEVLAAQRAALLDSLRADELAVDGDHWRRWPAATIPADPDAELLFQDPPNSVRAPAPGYDPRPRS
jgi:arylsulfatase A-like enzyme